MVRSTLVALLTLAAALPCTKARAADIQPEVIKQAKQASALVVLPSGRGFGSALCIDPSGYFLTNEHVIKSAGSEPVTLVLNAGEEDQHLLEAEVVRTNGEEVDLALLRVKSDKPLVHLEFGDVDKLVETQQLIAFGYPFGTALKVKEKEYPSISVNVGRITALRRSQGKLERIQLDAQLNQGNSGGPVITTDGKVIAVVHAGVLRTGVNFAIPISHAVDFLRPPGVDFEPPAVDYKDRYDEAEITARVVTFIKPQRDYDVKLILGSDLAPRRTIDAEHVKDDAYRIRAAALIKPEQDAPLQVEIAFHDGLIRGVVDDQKLKGVKGIGRLSEIRRIDQQDDGWSIAMRDGDVEKMEKFAPKGVVVAVGGENVPVDFSHVKTLLVYEPPTESNRVPLELVVFENSERVASVHGEWSISNVPIANIPPSARNEPPEGTYRPPTEGPRIGEATVVYKLPSAYTSVVSGGSGHFLVMHLKERQKVVVFDILLGKIVHEIPDVSDDVLLAASREKFMLVLPGDKLMQRWSLKTFKRERIAPLPGKGTTYRALMGENGDGPLLLGAEDAKLVDIETMAPLPIEGEIVGAGQKMQIRASANGKTFGAIRTGSGPVPFARMRVIGNRAVTEKFSSTSNAVRWSWPTADGTLMTGSTGIFGPYLEHIDANWLEGAAIYPTVDPRYFLAVRIAKTKEGKPVAHVHICTTCDRNIVYTYVGLEELAHDSAEWDKLPQHQINGGDERFIYVPWANMLVTLPKGNQQIVLRRFDVMQMLARSGVEYLFVDSIPPHQALIGQALRYQIEVKSKASGVKYRLETGPQGMTVSPSGLVTWNPPRGFAEPQVQAIIAISNGAGKEILHSFRVRVAEGIVIRPQ